MFWAQHDEDKSFLILDHNVKIMGLSEYICMYPVLKSFKLHKIPHNDLNIFICMLEYVF